MNAPKNLGLRHYAADVIATTSTFDWLTRDVASLLEERGQAKLLAIGELRKALAENQEQEQAFERVAACAEAEAWLVRAVAERLSDLRAAADSNHQILLGDRDRER